MYVRIKINQVNDCGNFFFIGGLENNCSISHWSAALPKQTLGYRVPQTGEEVGLEVIDFTNTITRIDYNGQQICPHQ